MIRIKISQVSGNITEGQGVTFPGGIEFVVIRIEGDELILERKPKLDRVVDRLMYR